MMGVMALIQEIQVRIRVSEHVFIQPAFFH